MNADALESIFAWVLRVSAEASVVVVLVLAVQLVLARRISARWRFNLWLLVVLRLAMPIVPESPWSPFNVFNGVAAPQAEPLVAASLEPTAARVAGDAGNPSSATSSPGFSPRLAVAADVPPPLNVPEVAADTAVQAASAERPPLAWMTWLAVAWLAGVAFGVARLVYAIAAVRQVVRRATPVEDPELLNLLRTCADSLGVRRPPALLRAAPVDAFGPALVGALRPKLVLPRALDGFGLDELRVIFLHELAHQRRRDVALNWLCSFAAALHWFNPVLRLAFRRMRADREMACDELALRSAGRETQAAYGPVLIRMLDMFSRRPAAASSLPFAGAVGVVDAGPASLRQRIAMIAEFDRNPPRRPLLAAALSVLLGGVALTGAVRGGEDRPADAESDTPRSPSGETPSALPTPPADPPGTQPIFSRRQPSTNPAVDPAYKTSPQDVIVVTVSDPRQGVPATQHMIVVTDAAVAMPGPLERVTVVGRTRAQIIEDLTAAYEKAGTGARVADVEVHAGARPTRPAFSPATTRPGDTPQGGDALAAMNALRREALRAEAAGTVDGDRRALAAWSRIRELPHEMWPTDLERSTQRIERRLEARQRAAADAAKGREEEGERAAAEPAKQRATIGEDELVTVSVMDLVGAGVETTKTSRVDPDGKISLPHVGAVKAVGLRPVELEASIAKAYREKKVLADAVVAVSLPSRGESHRLSDRRAPEGRPAGTPAESAAAAPPTSAPAALDGLSNTELVAYEMADLLATTPDPKERQGRINQLMEVVKVSAGPGASVTTFDTTLVVSARRQDHQAIQAVFKALRDRPAGPATRPAALPRAAPAGVPGAEAAPPKAAPVENLPAADMTIEDIARVDSQMATSLHLRDEIAFQIEVSKLRGIGPNQPQMRALTDTLKIRDGIIAARAEWFRAKYKGFHFTPGNGKMEPAAPDRNGELRRLREQYLEEEAKLKDLGPDHPQRLLLRDSIGAIEQRLERLEPDSTQPAAAGAGQRE